MPRFLAVLPGTRLSRRTMLSGALLSAAAPALGRIPYGGRIRIRAPWSFGACDPHDLFDATSALIGHALFDPLYALDDSGTPYPALAVGMPEPSGGKIAVHLRPGLRTARGQSFDARQVAWSLARSRRLGARALLAPFGDPSSDERNRWTIWFSNAEPRALAVALASPLSALIPRSFTRARPDGTGAFFGDPAAGRVTLHRNVAAARGSAYLDSVEMTRVTDLAGALRDFETGLADIGWLGAGLHRRRSGAVDFASPPLGYVLLRTGKESGPWGAPGVAQRLADAVPRRQLLHLGFTEERTGESTRWGGPPTRLLVDASAPHLVAVAQVIAAAVSQAAHEVTVAEVDANEVAAARRTGNFGLMLDFVRLLGPTNELGLRSLLAAEDQALAVRPPNLRNADERRITRTLRLGVIGRFAVVGAHAPTVAGVDDWRLGDVYVRPD